MSDIISVIQILTKRLLSGANPYASNTLESVGYYGTPNYLPMHWLPYSVAEFFHFDYRIMTFIIWFLGAVVIMWRSMYSTSVLDRILVPVLFTGCYLLITSAAYNIIGWTVETMIAGYYMLFLMGLNQKNIFVMGITISICLLSRYYIALWLPLWAFALFISGQKKQLFRVGIVILATLCILYIIPFLSKDWSALYFSFKKYGDAHLGVWQHVNDANRPGHLYNGVGFAYLFFERYPHANIITGYKLIQKVSYVTMVGTLLLMGGWYWFNLKKIDSRIFLLASFKIYLSVFLAFIMVPYIYLMVTASFVSIAIFAEQARYRLGKPDIT